MGHRNSVKRGAAAALRRIGLLSAATDLYFLLRSGGSRRGVEGPAEDGIPLPPPRLRLSAAGTVDGEWFWESGRVAGELLREILTTHRPGGGAVSILDFGCGSGRVLRHLRTLPGTHLFGVDWNRDAVRWCRRNLAGARFARCRIAPPLPLTDESFDLVYAFSVFTHLPEALQVAWLTELSGRLREGGLLVLSTHGDAFFDQLDAGERAAYRQGRLVVREPTLAGTNVCAAYHPPGALERLLPAGLEVVEHVDRGARGNPPQDLWVLRRIVSSPGRP